MSTYVHRLIEVKKDNKWELVDWNNPLQENCKLNKFTANQMGLDYDSLEKTQVKTYRVDQEFEERAVYKHSPMIVNNACTFRDEYLGGVYSGNGRTDWKNRGLPKDASEETKRWLNYYIYESDWQQNDDGTPVIRDDKFDLTYITIDELYTEVGNLESDIESLIKKYTDTKVKLEFKSLSITSDKAKELLDEEKEDAEYILEEINNKIYSIIALESEASFADNIVNNPNYTAIENDIRLIIFKTC